MMSIIQPQGLCPPSARRFAATLATQPIDRGVDFVGQVIKPWRRETRRRTVREAIRKVRTTPADALLEVGNSYFGLLRQSKSHHDRSRLANALRGGGHCIKGDLSKTYRRATK